jgi:hypothetical protein
MHRLLRYLKMLRTRAGTSNTGIEMARVELDRAREDSHSMGALKREMNHIAARASQIRENNHFDELMTRLVEQGRTRPHGSNPRNPGV